MVVRIDLYVDEHGIVVPDSTRVEPPIASARYDRALRSTMARHTFFPAVLEGCAVPGWARMDLTLPRTR